jgi:peptide/histidine transporter 3/4
MEKRVRFVDVRVGDVPHPSSPSDEDTPLLPGRRASLCSQLALRYSKTRKCISSKSALLILLWSFLLGLWNGAALNPDLFLRNFVNLVTLSASGLVAFIMLFFPLAGFLADIKYGRYNVIVRSLFLIVMMLPISILIYVFYIGATTSNLPISRNFEEKTIFYYTSACGIIVISYIGLVGFAANVVQFGMDQLLDSPGDDRTLFIHWSVWIHYTTIFIGLVPWNVGRQLPYSENIPPTSYQSLVGTCLQGVVPIVVIIALPLSLCLARYRKRWFLIEPGVVNPYRLVYRVTKFAHQHALPVRRSAFTFCEDKVPRGLDLGKEKYGGPFTTEQVEDVKVFYGILKVLFSFGTVFFFDFAASSALPIYALHTASFHGNTSTNAAQYNGSFVEQIFLNDGLFSPLLIAVCLPVYLCLLRPFTLNHIPGMLKRMGLGMVLVLVSCTVSFFMDIAAHRRSDNTVCMFKDASFSPLPPVPQNPLFLLIPLTLSALSRVLIYTSVLEFICSQSPHSMKGLLIGLLYAIKGLNQLLATLLVVPFGIRSLHFPPPSCGFYYYLLNIVIGALALLVYVWVSRGYSYRERDEPSHVRRYAEDYYSNLQDTYSYREQKD